MDLEGRGNGKELGRLEGGETIIQIYCIKKNIVSIKVEKHKQV